ncbi:MAG TPA: OmpA family protein, partial [Flavobacteriaceae bacterium]|nr:OmpA family protein [Flavobacteriaceae bacterium]
NTIVPIKEYVIFDDKNSLATQEKTKTIKVLQDDPTTEIVESDYIEEITYEEKEEIASNVYDFQRRIAYNTTMKETGRILKKRLEFTKEEKDCADNIEELDDIYFNLNKFNIRPDARIQVNKAIKIMEKCPNINFVASSYTDSRGSSEYNAELSQRRATSVVTYILNNSSISIDRIAGVGYGESGLKNKCYNGVKCTEKQHQENRRTEIEVYIYK